MTKPHEPYYSDEERLGRRKEVEALRKRAVASWNGDLLGDSALVLMSFADYCALVTNRPFES